MVVKTSLERKSTGKLETLLEIEEKIQKQWIDCKIFQIDAPNDGSKEREKPKYMCTFPYPYMNGVLHLGHAFTVSKCEFAAGFERLLGKNVLYPFGFHCTGMPIKACADKLVKEMEMYGNPPVFPQVVAEKVTEKDTEAAIANVGKAKKSKVAAKTGGVKYQWQIMKAIGIPEHEIPKFADASYWLSYFPPIAMRDLTRMGLKTDWRRSFITTEVNPYYDSFVRWQFLKLQEKGKIKFGKRYTVFSPKDQQPCMDHDRQTGEGVGPLEYTLIKIEIIDPVPQIVEKKGSSQKVFLVAATLRPETMYGQTNCWVHPDIKYIAYETKTKEIWISTARSARNMAYQEFFKSVQVDKICDIKGSDIIGMAIKAPLATYSKVYILPMLTIKEDKGTGVVTSVPSDSPDDYMALNDLKKKAAFRQKYNLSDEKVLPFDPVPLIEIPGFGDLAAVTLCEKMKIQSQNDSEKLAEAKKEVYMKGFYEGVMKVGKYSGTSVQQAKKLVQQQMMDENLAVKYMECESTVISRSNDICVVALCDQWYLDYGEEKWKERVLKECLPQVNVYSSEVYNNFVQTLDWLQEHACCRTYGLGSRLPWDETWLIESLSDSTIYNAYYAVAHLLQSDLHGSKSGLLNIEPEQMTTEIWDYIFLKDAPFPSKSKIEKTKLEKMKSEFRYWYPVDMRASGKDLIPNHLTYYLYNHVAIWEDEPNLWPKSIHANGHLLLNNEKMSKQTGNFLTLSESIKKFSADGMRLALADAGDNIEDANFLEKVADTAILRLYTFVDWVREVLEDEEDYGREGASDELFCDKVFTAEMDSLIEQTKEHYVKMNYKDALRTSFFEFQACRDRYRELSLGKLHKGLIRKFIRNQVLILSPICPHICEYIWSFIGEQGSILNALWPEVGAVDETIIKSCQYLLDAAHDFRLWHNTQSNPKPAKGEKGAPPKLTLSHGIVHVAERYPDWQDQIITALKELYVGNKNEFPPNNVIADKVKKLGLNQRYVKKSMPFAQKIKTDVLTIGSSVFEQSSLFSEIEVLNENKEYLKQTLNLEDIEIIAARDSKLEKIRDECCPLKPMADFYTAPNVMVEFVNPQPCSGYFTAKLPIYDGDDMKKVKRRLMRICKIKNESSLALYRYEDAVMGPLTLPSFDEPLKGKLKCEEGIVFALDVDKNSVNISNGDGAKYCINNLLVYCVDNN